MTGMSRRLFLTRVAKGTAAALVLAHVPVKWTPTLGGVRQYVALDYLRRAFNEHARGSIHNYPKLILVGSNLFDAAENELTQVVRVVRQDQDLFQRPNMPHHLMFKSAMLAPDGPGWGIHYMGPRKEPFL